MLAVVVAAATITIDQTFKVFFLCAISIDKHKPSWVNRVGWVLDSNGTTSDSLPDDLRKELAAAYEPFNQQLYRLLGKTFDW